MNRKIIEYLPFLGMVLAICTASWLAGRALPDPAPAHRRRGRTISQ
ncbi:hypothetical protein [Nonomuraea sp. SYSU D8015]|nr:hypothetical protein [Nonomuraea sp. SYSU D8015]